MLQHLSRLSRHTPPVTMDTVAREDFSDTLLQELHAFANGLMAEELEHFRVHALSNDLVHVFRRRDGTGGIVGFQFWKAGTLSGMPRSRVIIGGKLRIHPAFRQRGLHLLSGLTVFLQDKLQHPTSRHYRMSIASPFGFVSITEALSWYRPFEPRPRTREEHALKDAFLSLARESHFEVDEASGLFNVHIHMTPETLGRYPPEYFQRPAARAYAALNPDFRTNGHYVGFWFRFTPDNLASLTRATVRRLLGRRARGG
ncbi:hypothetical protein [Melittangium boletus]|uniref:N-acetyltransferase domain-containing protein n=1 Tax=Melittangium boletus DSM 14713 TaxID=1294270 RepID=A0A250IBH7_9BACT|nr:hypothetical protein [Melittangium boletus]ATB28501.1 hypothetical protein MEBOL_001949 [Melittangium boletus DSM 14713]